ncbi:MAG: DUF4342 domain-containing protein [Anaerovoracaceae bacterium]
MEISLEKIELVKDRTGVNYKEAKDALIKAEGSVVDAIIMIEDEIDIAPKSKAADQVSQMIENVKQLIHKGNVSKIVIRKDEEIILNVPVNLGIVGAVWLFWPTVVATIAALGMKCTIELVKDNGEVVSISEKAAETFGGVRENCSVIADDLREKSGEALSQVREKASDVISKNRGGEESCQDAEDDFEFAIEDEDPDDSYLEDPLGDADFDDDDYFNFDDFEDIIEDAGDAAEEKAEAVKDAAEDIADAAKEKAESAVDTAKDEIQKAGEKFEETIENYKKKKGLFKFFE